MDNTFLMQWNLNGFYKNLRELQLLIQLKSPAIIYEQGNVLMDSII